MSRITITDLPVGSTSSSTDYNATLTSWNSGTADHAVDDINIREEGIDRKNIVTGTIDSTSIGSSWFYESSTASSAMGAGPTQVSMSGGASLVYIGPAAVTGTHKLLVRCSAYFHTVDRGSQTKFYLRRSTDNATWTTVSVTTRYFQVDSVGLGGTIPCRQNVQITHLHAGGTGATWYYSLWCESAGNNATVDNVVLAFHMVTV